MIIVTLYSTEVRVLLLKRNNRQIPTNKPYLSFSLTRHLGAMKTHQKAGLAFFKYIFSVPIYSPIFPQSIEFIWQLLHKIRQKHASVKKNINFLEPYLYPF